MINEQLYFSIVIPAHNEEGYITNTLQHVKDLSYPADHFEVIVIENGSTDNTLGLAKEFEGGNISVMASKKGVSIARNIGIKNHNIKSNWTVLLDADTILERDFLQNLNFFLLKNKKKNYSIGTTSIKPIPDRGYARSWFAFYDIGHWLTKSSYSLLIVRNSVISKFLFDEGMTMGEEFGLTNSALEEGKFFFFQTKLVSTSTRRFDKEGWWKIFFSWTFVSILPPSLKRHFVYKVVR